MEKVDLALLNQLGELEKIVATIEEISAKWNLPDRVGMELNLVLEELFANIVFYAFDDGKEHVISMEFERTETGNIRVRLVDDGKPFNLLEKETGNLKQPLEERKIGGLGIHFAKEMMDNIEYERIDGKNVVLLTKNL